ncbi:MAG: DNA repair exonuclease [Alicyclobacillaceae bacterium]|nr:DNA repair exonuclease [Alicyclobacillaceae bacterium]
MRPFRFLHTADLHLGTPFQGLSRRVSDDWLRRVQSASYQVFQRIVDVALRERVDFVTVAGDLFDTEQAPMAVRFELRRGFERLAAHGVAVFVCHGNHDPLTSPHPLPWPDSVTVFPAAPVFPPPGYKVPSAWLRLAGGVRVQVAGFSYGQAELRTPMATLFERDPRADFAIALYHGTVGPSAGHAPHCPASEADLVARGFDFWGLGHIHQPMLIRRRKPTVLYAGNPQGRHIREQGPRGCWVVDVDEAGEVRPVFVDTSAVRWCRVEVDVTGIADLAGVLDCTARSLRDLAERERAGAASAAGCGCLVDLAWRGTTPVHASLLDEETRQALVDEACAGLEADLCVVRESVCTQPPVDLDKLRDSREFVGEWLRLAEAYRRDVSRLRAELGPLLTDVFHAGNGLDLRTLPDSELLELLEEAQRLLLQYLGEEEVAR